MVLRRASGQSLKDNVVVVPLASCVVSTSATAVHVEFEAGAHEHSIECRCVRCGVLEQGVGNQGVLLFQARTGRFPSVSRL